MTNYLPGTPFHKKEFRECILCQNPFVWDEKWNNDTCLWCEINKEEEKSEDENDCAFTQKMTKDDNIKE